jgi:DNA sulfur modification protein DndC
MGTTLDWDRSDDALFGPQDRALLHRLSKAHGLPVGLSMKLLELEISMDGLARRSEVVKRISEILGRDWDEADVAVKRKGINVVRLQDRDDEEAALMAIYTDLGRLS